MLVLMDGLDHYTLSQIERDVGIRNTVQVKQDNEFDSSTGSIYQYEFSMELNMPSLKGYVVVNDYIKSANSDRMVWATDDEAYRLFGRGNGTAALEIAELGITSNSTDSKNREIYLGLQYLWCTRSTRDYCAEMGQGTEGSLARMYKSWRLDD